VNKLEEQLRLSRMTEVAGLQPPTGGWEAISTQLQDDPIDKTDEKETPIMTNPRWWIIDLSLVLLFGGLAFSSVSPANADREPTSIVADAQLFQGAVPEIAETSLALKEAPMPTLEARNVTPVTGEGVRKNTTSEAFATDEPSLAAVEAAANSSEAEEKPDDVVSIQGVEQIEELPSVDANREVMSALTPIILKTGSESLFAGGVKPAKLTSLISSEAVEMLFVGNEILPISNRPASFTSLPSIVVSSETEFNRKRKLKIRPQIELHASLSGHYLKDFRGSNLYDRDVTTGGIERLFILPSGETLPVSYRQPDLSSNFRSSGRLDFGISRQSRSGFLFRLATGLYYSTNDRPSKDFNEVTGTEVREDFYERRFIIPLEVGLQYTFRKRHRFRPFLGLNLVRYLHNDAVQRTSFFDAQTGSEGLIAQLTSKGVNVEDLDFSITTGFQYKLTRRWSGGVTLYAHTQGSYLIESPFGVEVRYSLK
jgi:hypothetical protein